MATEAQLAHYAKFAKGGEPHRFQPGNKVRQGVSGKEYNSINKRLRDSYYKAADKGCAPEDVFMQVYQDETMPPDLRVKAAKQHMDVIKDSQQIVEVSTTKSFTVENAAFFLRESLGFDEEEEESDDEEETESTSTAD